MISKGANKTAVVLVWAAMVGGCALTDGLSESKNNGEDAGQGDVGNWIDVTHRDTGGGGADSGDGEDTAVPQDDADSRDTGLQDGGHEDAANDTGHGDAGHGDGDACEPRSCAPTDCGIIEDGCGASLTCTPTTTVCGTCDLGRFTCDVDSGVSSCEDIDLPLNLGQELVCDSEAAGSTLIFVDTQYTGTEEDGSRVRPFRSYESAVQIALDRGIRGGIVIGGSPTFTTPLTIHEGVSVYGGFGPSPDFLPNPGARPLWQVGSDHVDSSANELVGARAASIARRTVVSNIRVTTSNIPNVHAGKDGASNIAMRAYDAPGLRLLDVALTAGDAGNGRAGADGPAPTAAMNGGDASGRRPGAAPQSCSIPACVVTPVARQDSTQCGYGAYGRAPGSSWYPPNPGNAGTPDGNVTGGTAGVNAGDPSSGCNANPDDIRPGGRGMDGRSGPRGEDGTVAAMPNLGPTGRWIPAAGRNGQSGQPGTWGGGGGAGGGSYDSCHNSPRFGGHGAGGGAPGCGGNFGEGGGGGGASIALVARGSTGLVIRDGLFVAGVGGAGGAAGRGASGGTGGHGETNTAALCNMTDDDGDTFCISEGGRGGHGGAGGAGGHGGAGAGGASVAIYCRDSEIDVPAGIAQIREGGDGGSSATPSMSEGPVGVAAEQVGCQ